MSVEIKIPQLPESVTEASIIGWHKQVGDTVKQDENLVDIETEKVTLEVPAPADGTLQEVTANEGDVVTADQVIGRIEEGEVEETGAAGAKEAEEAGPEPAEAAEASEAAAGAEAAESAEAAEARPADEARAGPLSPAVRKLLDEHNLDPTAIQGSGKGGRLLKEDVLRYLRAHEGEGGAAQAQTPEGPGARPEEAAAPEVGGEPERPEQRVPMTRLRARVAERLLEAQQQAAMLTTFNDVNMQPVMDLRRRYRERFEEQHGVRLGLMSFFTRAATEALKRFPVINASVDGNDIVYHGYYDIGIAVSAPRGLVVPVLRDTDTLSMAEIERQIRDLGKRAESGSLTIEELTGGTFTITNGGVFGSLLSTPILNPPQSAILGMHRVEERPVAVDGEVVIRPMMYLALTYDHRLVDGREAVTFLATIKALIEEPARMLLEI